uniref:Uncharacterized protein n=1 Tax=mine drainage metagenome TaxID=410659 RepID=E6PZG3_9ZZZZ
MPRRSVFAKAFLLKRCGREMGKEERGCKARAAVSEATVFRTVSRPATERNGLIDQHLGYPVLRSWSIDAFWRWARN